MNKILVTTGIIIRAALPRDLEVALAHDLRWPMNVCGPDMCHTYAD